MPASQPARGALAALFVALLVALWAPAASASCPTSTYPCCTGASETSDPWDCDDTGQAEATNVVLTADVTRVGSTDELECTLEFEYAWDTPDCPENGAGERTLRICMFYCDGNDTTCLGSCLLDCRQISVANGAPQQEVFTKGGLSAFICHFCFAAVIDVTGNESCNAPPPCTAATCAAGCGPGVIGARSDCDEDAS